MGNIFDIIFVNPLINAMVAIYHLLTSAGIPYAVGFSIVGLTAVIRIVISPLLAHQIKAQKKMQAMQPHLSKIKEKHKGDAKAQQAATMALYKEHEINPAAGCLPLLVQLPLFWALFHVIQEIVKKDGITYINKAVYSSSLRVTGNWDTSFFGLPIGQSPSELVSTTGFLIVLVPIITAALMFVQSKMLAPKVKKDAVKKDGPDDFATTFQKQSMYLIPIIIGFAGWTFSIGLSLYWNTFTIFGIIQQYFLNKDKNE